MPAAKQKIVDEIIFRNSQELRQLLINGQGREIGRPLQQITADLIKPIPFPLISWQPGRKKDGQQQDPIPYIAHSDVCLLLDFYAPGWSNSLTEGQQIDGSGSAITTIQCTITIHAQEGAFSRCSTGWDLDLDSKHWKNYGGPIPDAEAVAIRRAAMRWGLFRYAYDPEEVEKLVTQLKQEKSPRGRTWYELAQQGILNKVIEKMTPPEPPAPNPQLVHEGTMPPVPAPRGSAMLAPDTTLEPVSSTPLATVLPVPAPAPAPIPSPTPAPVAAPAPIPMTPTATVAQPVVSDATKKADLKQKFLSYMKQMGVSDVKEFWTDWAKAYQRDGVFPFAGKTFAQLSATEAEEVVAIFEKSNRQQQTPAADLANLPF